MKTTTIAFYLLTTFSTNVGGGNPAAVVFMDLTRPLDVYKNIAHNFNQPITTFLSPLRRGKKCLAFNVRWFAPNGQELPLCGHGTLAAARTIFESYLVKHEIPVLEFHTTSGQILTARKCEEGLVEICLVSSGTVEVSPQERSRLQGVLNRTFGREVTVNHIARGGEGYEHYMMVDLDEKENLKDMLVDSNTLRESGFTINIFTTMSSSGTERFVSRMFAPGLIPGGEDHVCGSAHCVITPYWYDKLGISRGLEIQARQVSPRGGELGLLWEADQNVLRVRGAATILAKGELQIPFPSDSQVTLVTRDKLRGIFYLFKQRRSLMKGSFKRPEAERSD